MVTDLMADETALEFGKVLGERNEGFIQMSYVPDDVTFEGDAIDHSEKRTRNLRSRPCSGRPILYNAIAVNDAHPERYPPPKLKWLGSCAKRGIRVLGQSATLQLNFTFSFKEWNLWDDMPAWRECTTGPVEDRLMKLSDPLRRPGLRAVEQTGAITNSTNDIIVLECKRPDLKKYENLTIGEIAKAENKHPIDAMLDIACADSLNTDFYSPPQGLLGQKHVRDGSPQTRMAIFGVSDGGAHTKFFTGGRYPTETLINFVREN